VNLREFVKQVDKLNMKNFLADLLTRILNGQKAKLSEIILFWPFSKKYISFLILLEKEGLICGFKNITLKNKNQIVIFLKYDQFQNPLINKIQVIKTPGKRRFCKSKNL
jgi:ribosomal protein S8